MQQATKDQSDIEIGSNIQTIVWDLDGTLLDSFSIYKDCLNAALHELNRPEAPEHILRNNHHGFIEDSIAQVLVEMGQSVTKAELADIIQRFYALDNQAIENVDDHLFADAIDLARRLHQSGKRQIVTTNRPHGIDRGNGSPRALIQNSCLHEYITDVLCGDDGEYRKPHRQFLEARFGSNLETLGRMIFIGDQFVDAEFARNCDSPAILVARNNTIAHLDRLDTREQRTQIVASLNAIHVADIAPAKQIPDISAMLVDSATNTKTA